MFPGTAADESRWVDILARHVSLPNEQWDAMTFDAEDVCDVASPGRILVPGMVAAGTRVARSRGANVVLNGVGGDEVFFEHGVFRDLAAHAQWRALWREARLAPRYSTRGATRWLRDALAAITPNTLHTARNGLRGLRLREPEWMTPELRALDPVERETDGALVDWPSHTQRWTWRAVTNIDLGPMQAGRVGVETRSPLLDRRVVDVVLSAHWHWRIPHGRMKVLLRDALIDLLPWQIAERAVMPSFEAAVQGAMKRRLSWVRELFHEGPWSSEAYVHRSRARAMLSGFVTSGRWTDMHTVWTIASLEAWLRSLRHAGLV
jgi:asparagine synthetase B (glutamine-hydrolysing)